MADVRGGDDRHRREEAQRGRSLRLRLRRGEVVFGPFMKLASPQIVEIAGYAGFDFVILDTEHGPLSFETVENLVRASQGAGIAPVVRVYENTPSLISRCLDVGAQGVLAPHISSKAEATRLARAARFAPAGDRGVCCYVRAARFSDMDKYTYFDSANKDTLVVAMIEGREGLANVDEIVSVPGLDVIFIGPYDLSQSLGVPGQVTGPQVTTEMRRVVHTARAAGLAVGTFVDDIEGARRWAESGVQFISLSVDVAIIYQAMRNMVGTLRAERHAEEGM